MKIAFIVGHPTQFEGPFYQYFEKEFPGVLEVIFHNPSQSAKTFDPELSFDINWGIDIISGYKSHVLPHQDPAGTLKKLIDEQQYDFVVINGYNHKILRQAASFCKKRGIPTGLRLDTVLFIKEPFIKRVYRKLTIYLCKRFFNHFFVTGKLGTTYLNQYKVPNESISRLSYIVDNEYFAQESKFSPEEIQNEKRDIGIDPSAKVILCICKLVPRESPWDVVKALSHLPKGKVHLLVVGDGPERAALQELASSIEGVQYTFMGYVPYVNLPKMYSLADLFIHPTHDEPWGVSVQEAIACDLPVITSDRVGAAYDLILKGENGFIYPYGDHKNLSDLIFQALFEFKTEDVKEANARVLTEWNYEESSNRLITIAESYGK